MAQSTSNLSSSDRHHHLGCGLFWCVEAVFEAIPGVVSGESGYSGGHIKTLDTGKCAREELAMQKWFN